MQRRKDPSSGLVSEEFKDGVDEFIQVAKQDPTAINSLGHIPCPCARCKNRKRDESFWVEKNLYGHGFMDGYVNWTIHGEKRWGESGSTVVADDQVEESTASNAAVTKKCKKDTASTHPPVNSEIQLQAAGRNKKRRVDGTCLDLGIHGSKHASPSQVVGPSTYPTPLTKENVTVVTNAAVASFMEKFMSQIRTQLHECIQQEMIQLRSEMQTQMQEWKSIRQEIIQHMSQMQTERQAQIQELKQFLQTEIVPALQTQAQLQELKQFLQTEVVPALQKQAAPSAKQPIADQENDDKDT